MISCSRPRAASGVHRDGKASKNPRGRAGFVPSFQISNGIHDLMESYRQRGVRIVEGVSEVSHGWIACIGDLEGNVLQIYQTKSERINVSVMHPRS